MRLMEEQETMTRFAYYMLWIVSAYLNACILASMAAAEGDPGERTPVLFQYLIDELDHGRYTGRALPRSIRDLLTVRAGIHAALASTAALHLPAPRTICGYGQDGGGGGGRGGVIVPRGRRRNDRDGEVILNPCPI